MMRKIGNHLNFPATGAGSHDSPKEGRPVAIYKEDIIHQPRTMFCIYFLK